MILNCRLPFKIIWRVLFCLIFKIVHICLYFLAITCTCVCIFLWVSNLLIGKGNSDFHCPLICHLGTFRAIDYGHFFLQKNKDRTTNSFFFQLNYLKIIHPPFFPSLSLPRNSKGKFHPWISVFSMVVRECLLRKF